MRRYAPFPFLLFAFAGGCDGGSTYEVERLAVIHIGPSPGAAGIGTDSDVRVTFSEVLRVETVNPGSICLVLSSEASDDCAGVVVPAQVSYDAAEKVVRLEPVDPLVADQEYALRITTAIRGKSGSLHSPIRTLFRTRP